MVNHVVSGDGYCIRRRRSTAGIRPIEEIEERCGLVGGRRKIDAGIDDAIFFWCHAVYIRPREELRSHLEEVLSPDEGLAEGSCEYSSGGLPRARPSSLRGSTTWSWNDR